MTFDKFTACPGGEETVRDTSAPAGPSLITLL